MTQKNKYRLKTYYETIINDAKKICSIKESAEVVETRPMTLFLKNYHHALIGVEIGTYKGSNARNILLQLPIKKLYLIDPYKIYERTGKPLVAHLHAAIRGYYRYNEAKKAISKYKKKVCFIREYSDDALEKIPDDVDFIYIDGNHDYEYVKKDIELYYPKVKHGGIFGGHDFSDTYTGVRYAVNEFITEENLRLYTDDVDWWVVKP